MDRGCAHTCVNEEQYLDVRCRKYVSFRDECDHENLVWWTGSGGSDLVQCEHEDTAEVIV